MPGAPGTLATNLLTQLMPTVPLLRGLAFRGTSIPRSGPSHLMFSVYLLYS